MTPSYCLTAKVSSSTSLAGLIPLIQVAERSKNHEGSMSLTTPAVRAVIGDSQESLFSPTMMLIRFAEFYNSSVARKSFNELTGFPASNIPNVVFPKKGFDADLRISGTVVSDSSELIESNIEQFSKYLSWAREAFNQQINKEAEALGITTDYQADDLISIQSPPSLQGPIKPKKALIISLSFMLGGMVGVVFVLIRQAVRNRRARGAA